MRRNDDPPKKFKKKVRVLAEYKPLGDDGRDESFVKEAEKLRRYFGEDVDFDINPFYGDEEFSNIDLNGTDEVFMLGHKGANLGGIPHTQIADNLKKSGVKSCYLGSCSMTDELIDPYKSLERVRYRDDKQGSWYGIDENVKPNEDGTYDMDKVLYNKRWTGNPNDFYGAGIVDAKEGREYNKIINRTMENPVSYKSKPKVFFKGGQLLQHLFGESDSLGSMGAGILGSLIPTDSIGGKTASSALTGLMSAGPVGGLVGAGMGLMSGFAEKRREEENSKKRMELEKKMFRNRSRSVLSNYPTEGVDSSGFYKSGGRMKSHNFMTTGGYLSPVASDTSIANGRTHNEGGINLYDNNMDNFAEIEDQEIIKQDKVYSNRLKVPVYLQQALKLKRK